jgi:hypothetical protein
LSARLIEGELKAYCRGYELAADLDFDTNGDGKMNELDTFGGCNSVWQPIGSRLAPFTAVLEGNGHSIYNLYINELHLADCGLLGIIGDYLRSEHYKSRSDRVFNEGQRNLFCRPLSQDCG